jgi:Glycosyltransferase Family 4
VTRILVISYSDLTSDARVDRQIGFLRSAHDVVAAGLGPPAYDDVGFIDLRVDHALLSDVGSRAALLLRILAHRYIAAYWGQPESRASLARLASPQCDLVLANELPSLPLACRVASTVPVLFDAHEMATTEWSQIRSWRLLRAPYIDSLLRHYLPRVDGMMTVSDGIADLYFERYGIRPTVVTNACSPAALAPTPVHTPVRMICHGNADRQRRLEVMIEATAKLEGRYTLDLMLMPTDHAYINELRRVSDATPWVNVIAPRPQREIVQFCSQYDIGVYVLPPLNENALHALPNKIFEFIQARLAVVVGPSPEMAALVRSWELGVVAKGFTVDDLAGALDHLTPERVAACKLRAHAAARELNSDRNSAIVLKLVEQALSWHVTGRSPG